jgi:predicted P-loop ATPase/GTPase
MRCARSLGILTLSSGGAIVLAKQRGIGGWFHWWAIDRLKRLQEADLWISADVIALLKQKASEY